MRIAINGFGRIGRIVFKVMFERGMNVVAVNDVHGSEDAAYLLKYDSVYGKYGKSVVVKGKNIVVGGKKILILSEREPEKLPWKKLGVDVVVEATGAFRSPDEARRHIKAGAKYVLITAPVKEGKPDLTIVPGVNDEMLKKEHKLISVASCTTNCLAPMVKVLDDSFGLVKGFMTTVHAYTSSQGLVDGSARKPRRGRAAAVNIVPTTSGATDAVVEVLPKMKGKLNGVDLRVPVSVGSLVDLVAELKDKADVKKINSAFQKAASGKMKGIIEYSDEELVSSDVIGNSHSTVFDSLDTQVNRNLVKVLAWYDNEWGYSNRVADVVKMLQRFLK